MRDGFIKVAAGTPEIRVADCAYNAQQCIVLMEQAREQGVKVLCLPELVLTGATCGDLFFQETLLDGAERALEQVLEASAEADMLITIGLPVRGKWGGKLYNCAAVIHQGSILCLVPKTHLTQAESRWFVPGEAGDVAVTLAVADGQPPGAKLLAAVQWSDTGAGAGPDPDDAVVVAGEKV